MINFLPSDVTEVQLRKLFEKHGAIASVKIVCDHKTRQSKGYGFVKFQSAQSANAATQQLNGHAIGNKRLKVQHAKQKAEKPDSVASDAPAPLYPCEEGSYSMTSGHALKAGDAGYLKIDSAADIPTKPPTTPLRTVIFGRDLGSQGAQKAIKALQQFCDAHLAHLDLGYISGISGSSLVDLAKICPYLEWIDAKQAGVSFGNLKELARLCPRLKFIDMRETSAHEYLCDLRPSEMGMPKRLLVDL